MKQGKSVEGSLGEKSFLWFLSPLGDLEMDLSGDIPSHPIQSMTFRFDCSKQTRLDQTRPGKAKNSQVQPGTAMYSLVEPSTAWYTQVQPGTAKYSVVQPSIA